MTDTDRIVTLGQAMFGAKWQRQTAAVLRVDEKMIRMWVAKQCVPPAHHVPALIGAARGKIEEIREAIADAQQ